MKPTPTTGGWYTHCISLLLENQEEELHKMETMKIAGRSFPVVGAIHIDGKAVRLLNIRMMSDERERELGRKAVTA